MWKDTVSLTEAWHYEGIRYLAQGLLPDGEGVVEEVGCLLVLVLVPVHQRQDVQHRRHVRVVVPARLLQVLKGLQKYLMIRVKIFRPKLANSLKYLILTFSNEFARTRFNGSKFVMLLHNPID